MQNQVKNKLINAYKLLLKNDSYLMTSDANERSITHKLAEYIQLEFPEYNVDCEYNRIPSNSKITHKLAEIKKLKIPRETNDTNAVSVYPDIIVHHRGTNNNFIVIEAKKSNIDDEYDKKKLRVYKDELNYKYAYTIIFMVREEFSETKEINFDELIKEIGNAK